MRPSSIAFAFIAASDILTGSPFVLSVKKNLPDFVFLSATVYVMFPAFLRRPTDASIGSSSLYISSNSSISADLGPVGIAEILFGVAFTTASFTPFCILSFSLDAISGFTTSEGFLRPGLVLAGVALAVVEEAVDLFSGSAKDCLAVPNRLAVLGVGLVAAAVVGRLIPLDAVAVDDPIEDCTDFLGVVSLPSTLSLLPVIGVLLGVAVTAEGLLIPKVFFGAGVFGPSA